MQKALRQFLRIKSTYFQSAGLFSNIYLTLRLRARDFYAVIVDEGEARINYHCIEIESE